MLYDKNLQHFPVSWESHCPGPTGFVSILGAGCEIATYPVFVKLLHIQYLWNFYISSICEIATFPVFVKLLRIQYLETVILWHSYMTWCPAALHCKSAVVYVALHSNQTVLYISLFTALQECSDALSYTALHSNSAL